MMLAYQDDPSFFAVGRALGVHVQPVQRGIERAAELGALAALEDRPRPGREPEITVEARAWLVDPAGREAKEFGYPHEVWTTRLLAAHARERAAAAGHRCLSEIALRTVCKILDAEDAKPHRVRHYPQRRDPEFGAKMAEVPWILDNHSAHVSKETRYRLATQRAGRFEFVFTLKHGSWLNPVQGFWSKFTRSVLRHLRVASKQELKDRMTAAIDHFNRNPVVHTSTYKLDRAPDRIRTMEMPCWRPVSEVRGHAPVP